MLALTDTPHAPWHLVPANDKRYARLDIIRHACRRISAAMAEIPNAKRSNHKK